MEGTLLPCEEWVGVDDLPRSMYWYWRACSIPNQVAHLLIKDGPSWSYPHLPTIHAVGVRDAHPRSHHHCRKTMSYKFIHTNSPSLQIWKTRNCRRLDPCNSTTLHFTKPSSLYVVLRMQHSKSKPNRFNGSINVYRWETDNESVQNSTINTLSLWRESGTKTQHFRSFRRIFPEMGYGRLKGRNLFPPIAPPLASRWSHRPPHQTLSNSDVFTYG